MLFTYTPAPHPHSGQPIPHIEYTAQETEVWGTVLRELKQLYPHHACKEFNRAFPLFNFREDEIPQLQDLSKVRCVYEEECGYV